MAVVIQSLPDLIDYVRDRSPFFRDFYSALPKRVDSIERVPVLDQDAYWRANTPHNNRLLTGPMRGGWVFSSGGTTGSPKFSFFDREEFEAFTTTWTRGAVAAGIAPGDRVGNFLRTGQLYGAFVIISRVLELATNQSVIYPLAGTTPPAEAFSILRECGINVLLGFPTVLVNLCEYYSDHRAEIGELNVGKVMYTGEALYPSQRQIILRAFPKVQISSFGYASVDGGPLGYADAGCGGFEHRTYAPETIFEILDEETGEPIRAPRQPGRIVVTNLTRRVMPILRYPVGDRAEWVDEGPPDGRKFRLVGRASESARLASVSIFYTDVAAALANLSPLADVQAFQMLLSRANNLDLLTIRIAVHNPDALPANATDRAREVLRRSKPELSSLVEAKRANPVAIEWVRFPQLESNARTGKLRRIIDARFA